jgi:hypothetical protein
MFQRAKALRDASAIRDLFISVQLQLKTDFALSMSSQFDLRLDHVAKNSPSGASGKRLTRIAVG